MAVVENALDSSRLDSAVFGGCAPCRMPWRSRVPADHSGSVLQHLRQQQDCSTSDISSSRSVSAVAKAFLVTKSRLKLDPSKNLIFLYEPGKQVASAVKIKNVSRSPVAFKFQTTAPKSCFMCPPNGVIMPDETVLAKVVKYVEAPEGPQQQPPKKLKDKFRIVSVKVKEGVDYTPELFEEQREFVAVERVLRVVFLDPQTASPVELEKQQKRLAEADAAQEARKKPQDDRSQKGAVAQGFVIDEWKERREKYLAKQQAEGQDSY